VSKSSKFTQEQHVTCLFRSPNGVIIFDFGILADIINVITKVWDGLHLYQLWRYFLLGHIQNKTHIDATTQSADMGKQQTHHHQKLQYSGSLNNKVVAVNGGSWVRMFDDQDGCQRVHVSSGTDNLCPRQRTIKRLHVCPNNKIQKWIWKLIQVADD